MDFKDVAAKLVEYCNTGQERKGLDTLYAEDAVSVEAADFGGGRETHGLKGIHGKHDWWASANETTKSEAEGPYFHGPDRFAVIFTAEGREKESGKAFSMREVGIYTVTDGKITREEFFYTM